MKDMQREIINQVAAGKISAEEGAARLESLDSAETTSAAVPVQTAPVGSPTATARRVKVTSVVGSAEIIGDPSVAYAVAEGPHKARQDGDTMVIQNGLIEDNYNFIFAC